MPADSWRQLEDGVHVFEDSCNVYAVSGPEGLVLINAGTGRCAGSLAMLSNGKPVHVLLTHHFRDHTDGALRLHEAGAEIIGPYWDQEYLLDPDIHFKERQTWNLYDNRWDRFSPVRPLPVSDFLLDLEKRRIAGLEWEVVPTPGVTNGASSYIVSLNGRRLAFVGEVICGEGRTSRLAPLQYNYNDLSGAVNIWHSVRRLMESRPERLYPSLGAPIDRPRQAVDALRANLRRLDEIQPGFSAQLVDPEEDDLQEILPHVFISRYAGAKTTFILSDSGKVLSIDYGYNHSEYVAPGRQHLSNRRPFLHGLNGLKKRFGVDRVHTILVSHFHDDHVNGIPLAQRVLGSEVWAAGLFSDILERPRRYDRPCLWHEPIHVARRLPCHETFQWENIPITLYPMSGHTRFATLICFEVDGLRACHTGDQMFFRNEGGVRVSPGYVPGARLMTNHVYKNGLDLGCYRETVDYLKKFKPEIVFTGHTDPFHTDPTWWTEIERGAKAFDELHRLLMLLDDDAPHFGPESQGAKLKPYRAHAPQGGRIEFDGWILNPFPSSQTAIASLVAPAGWKTSPVEVSLGPREQKVIRISVEPPAGTQCRRQPVALDLEVGGRPFGQVVEALVTVGMPRF